MSVLVAVTLPITAGSQLGTGRCGWERKSSAFAVMGHAAGPRRLSFSKPVRETAPTLGTKFFPALAEFGRVCAYDRPRFDEVGHDLSAWRTSRYR